MSRSILFVTPNTSIDKVILVPGYRPGHIHRPQQVIPLAGGKGLNAARAARLLGADVQACIMAGGHSGKWLVEQLEAENTPAHVAWIQGETRTCTIIADPETRQLTEVYEHGTEIEAHEWSQFESTFADTLETVDLVVMSGSLPPGSPSDGYARLIQLAKEQNIRTLIDSSGNSLKQGLEARPYGVKINQHEASDLVQQPIATLADAKSAATTLLERGIQVAIITMGKTGAVAVSATEAWFGKPPEMDAYLSVGSGDAMMGAIALRLTKNDSLRDMLQLGIASGLANALIPGTGMIEPETVQALYDRVHIQAL